MNTFLLRLTGWFAWAALAAMGLIFALSVLVWVAVAVVFSLVASLLTGRPAAVTQIWRQYRDLAQRRWPQAPGSRTPRADAAQTTGSAVPSRVEDVRWRDVADAPAGADAASHSAADRVSGDQV